MITTPRLLIRPFQDEDYTALFDYLANPDVYRFEPGEPITLEQAKQLTHERAQSTEFLAVILRSSQIMVGHLYFKQIEPPQFATWELGYIFNPKFHNQGYATEASKALLHYGFNELGIHRVFARCNPENIASWKVLEKLNMRREGYFRQKAFFRRDAQGSPLWFDALEYAILAEEMAA